MAWPPGGWTIGTPWLRDVVAEICGRGDAVAQVVFFQRFLNADGDGFEVASGEAAVGGIAFGEDQQIFFLLRQQIVIGAEEAADIGHAVFFGGHGASVAVAEHFLRDFFRRFVGVPFSRSLMNQAFSAKRQASK